MLVFRFFRMNVIKMKQVVLILLFASMIASCNKNKDDQSGYLCSKMYYRVGGTIGFIGYSLHDLDTIYSAKYSRNSGFSVLQRSDTFVFNQVLQNMLSARGDTIYLSSTPARQPYLTDSFDYRISVPATGTEYSISDVRYVLYVEWHSPAPCHAGSPYHVPSAKTPDSAWVDGQLTYGYPLDFPIKTIFLRKK